MMKVNLSLIAVISILFISSCSIEAQQQEFTAGGQSHLQEESLAQKIAALEAKLHTAAQFNAEAATEAVTLYTAFAAKFPEHKQSADYLFKAAELLTRLKKYSEAIANYELICSKYPQYIFATEALYLQAYLYDSFLQNRSKAKETYEKVIRTYPDHKFAQDSKTAIKQLGTSDQELIREFKTKNKKNDVSITSPQRISFPSIFYTTASVS